MSLYTGKRLSFLLDHEVPGLLAKGLLRIDPSRIRLLICDAYGDMKIPFVLGGKDIASIREALLELVSHIKHRLEGKRPEGLISPATTPSTPLPPLPPITYKGSVSEDLMLGEPTLEALLFSIPILDRGILRTWTHRGKGSTLMDLLLGIYHKALEEEIRQDGKEHTAYIAQLAILNILKRIKREICDIRVKGLSYERWEYYTGLLLSYLLIHIVEKALKEVKERFPLYDLSTTDLLLKTTLTAGSLVDIKEELWKIPFNPYSLNPEIYSGLERLSEGLEARKEGIEMLTKRVLEEKDLPSLICSYREVEGLRSHILHYLRDCENQKLKEHELLIQMVRSEKPLFQILSNKEERSRFLKVIRRLIRDFRYDRKGLTHLEGMEALLRRGWLSFIRKKEASAQAVKEAVESYFTLKVDQEVWGGVNAWIRLLKDRREELKPQEIRRDYEKGRLYRFSSDGMVVLKTPSEEKEAYLFIDMKDFTRKTFRIKEVAMADFMRTRFFQPIIEAASKYGLGKDMAEGVSIRIRNILGDAILLSGNISSLIFLAQDIQRIMERYRKELFEKFPPDVTLRKQQGEALPHEGPGPSDPLKALERRRILEEAFREEQEEMLRKELVAGLYISYGTKAEDIHIKDDLWGRLDVAIGEKINEAARGVERNPMVRLRLSKILEGRRKRLGNPGLSLPFHVYIGRGYSITLDPDLSEGLEDSIIKKDKKGVERVLREFERRLGKDIEALTGGDVPQGGVLKVERAMYNTGQALSEEALKAFVEETRATILHFDKAISVSNLADELKRRFLFLEEELRFFISVKRDVGERMVLVFREVGELSFKGFEGGKPVTVYELLRQDSPFYNLFLRYHVNDWIEEALKYRAIH